MSRENVELARRGYDAVNQRDLSAFLALMDADVGAVPLVAAIEGDYLGHDGMRRWWNSLRPRDQKVVWWGSYETEAEALEAVRLHNSGR